MALIAKDTAEQAFIPQGTPEWVRERIGHLTASNMVKAMSFLKDGTESAERRKLKHQILAERLTDAAVDHYVSSDMQWGLDYEEEAQTAYAALTGHKIHRGGFVKHPTIEFFGASPDCFVFPDGLLETKCPRTETHVGYIMAGVVPDEYKPQMVAQIACTGRKWVDFCSYDPRVQVQKRKLFIMRYTPTADEIKAVEDAAAKFLGEVEAMFNTMVS